MPEEFDNVNVEDKETYPAYFLSLEIKSGNYARRLADCVGDYQ
jgi:hypothetical protein